MMTQSYGYMGKILWVNLTTKEIIEEEPGYDVYRKYLGGYGLGIHYIYSRIKPNCDPLGPDNILGFCPGLFTGTAAPFTGRFMVCGKSPITGRGNRTDGKICTGGWGDANSGGYFGPAIKRAGYDAIFFAGASDQPVYLLIDGDNRELVDASDLWGQDIVETEKILVKKHGKGFKVSGIGVGGENQLLYAGIVNDKGRIAARSGLGAVMGSKKLKALCIKGNKKIAVKDKAKVIELAKDYRKQINKYFDNKLFKMILPIIDMFTPLMRLLHLHLSIVGKFPFLATPLYAQFFRKYGTHFFSVMCHDTGDTPLKNYKGIIKDFPKKKSKAFHKTVSDPQKKKKFGCFGCPVQCGAILEVPELNYEDKETHRPEYETIAAFGGLILNNNYEEIVQLNEYLNREGVDTISAGGVVSYMLECVENGLLKKEDFKCKEFPDGFLPKWGESEYLMPLLRMIVNREGIGNILANGSKKASEEIKNSAEYAIQANGMELPMHDARGMKGLMMTYVTDPTPGRHTAAGGDFLFLGSGNKFAKGIKFKNGKSPEVKGKCQAEVAKFKQVFNSVGFCEFSVWCGFYPLWDMFEAVVGWDIKPEEIFQIGWRIQTLRQMFNAREGAIRHEIAKRAIGDPPQKKGVHKNSALDMEKYIQKYYEHIGFSEIGIPLDTTLKELGIELCLKDLPKAVGCPAPLINNYISQKTQ